MPLGSLPRQRLHGITLTAVMAWLLAWAGMWPFDMAPSFEFLGIQRHAAVPWLQVICLALLIRQLFAQTTRRQAVFQSWWMGVNWLAATTWWLTHSMTVYGGLSHFLAGVAVFALAAALAVYFAVTLGYLAWHICAPHRATSPVTKATAITAGWVLAEWLRAKWFTGFPWGELGYAHIDAWGWLAPMIGVSGVTALVVFATAWVIAAWPFPDKFAARLKPRTILIRMAVVAVLIIGLPESLRVSPVVWTQPAGTQSVALLQGNVDQSAKFSTGAADAVRWYVDALQSSQADLRIVPETAIPMIPEAVPKTVWNDLVVASRTPAATLIGIPVQIGATRFQNEAWAITPNSQPSLHGVAQYRYAKHHLVPFGELSPPGFRWFTRQMAIPLSDFSPGNLLQPHFDWGRQILAITICYEDVFGDELAQRMFAQQMSPTAWVNMSNLAWFGDTTAIPSHALMARWRAIELGRPMLRATNTGTTAVIDHRGVVVAALPQGVSGVLTSPYEGRTGLTPYVAWAGRWGHTPLWVLSLLILVFLRVRQDRV